MKVEEPPQQAAGHLTSVKLLRIFLIRPNLGASSEECGRRIQSYRPIMVSFVMGLFLCLMMQGVPALAKTKKDPKEPYAFNERYLMAVIPFADRTQDKSFPDSGAGARLADAITHELFQYGRFRLIERVRLDAVLEEMHLQQTGYFKEDVVTQIGKQLGAECILVGSITDYNETKKRKSIGIASTEEFKVVVAVEARIVLLATGEIMNIARWKGEESSKRKRALVAVSEEEADPQELLSKLLDEAVQSLAKELCRQAPRKE